MKDKVTYIVTENGCNVSNHRSEAAAIKSAQASDGETSVVMRVESGTYQSTTQVWPTIGTTYSN